MADRLTANLCIVLSRLEASRSRRPGCCHSSRPPPGGRRGRPDSRDPSDCGWTRPAPRPEESKKHNIWSHRYLKNWIFFFFFVTAVSKTITLFQKAKQNKGINSMQYEITWDNKNICRYRTPRHCCRRLTKVVATPPCSPYLASLLPIGKLARPQDAMLRGHQQEAVSAVERARRGLHHAHLHMPPTCHHRHQSFNRTKKPGHMAITGKR